MALPGGGIVSVPLSTAAAAAAAARKGVDGTSSPDSAAGLAESLLLSGASASAANSIAGAAHSAAAAANAAGGGKTPAGGSGGDVLTVNAGEPVTHFNLDQLLEIVQSFQLDTTLAGNEDLAQQHLNLSLANPPTESPIVKNASNDARDLSGCELTGPLICDRPTSSGSHHLYGDSSSAVGVAGSGANSDANGGNAREIHSCPSSPTETDCSSGFSTLRRRSVTLTEKIRTNRDGSKTQVVRQYGCNTSSAKEPQSVTYQQNAFVYINGKMEESACGSQSFPSLVPITNTSPSSASILGGGNAAPILTPGHATLPRSAAEAATSAAASAGWTNTAPGQRNAGGGSGGLGGSYRGHIVRLNSIEPNTVMFSTKDYPLLGDITVPEIIDELEKQFEDKLNDLQGVRLVANNVYICLSRKDSLQHLTTYGFYVRGVPIKVVDITNDSVVICLTGVPHYITDATITMLVSTFGISIGEVERRFYKGIDTGERFVRLKPRAHTQVPDFVTVGGCKILIRVLSQEEVCQPFTLQSSSAGEENANNNAGSSSPFGSTKNAHGASTSGAPSSNSRGEGSGALFSGLSSFRPSSTTCQTSNGTANGKSRAKPGHCNGTISSPPPTASGSVAGSGNNNGSSSGSDLGFPPPPLAQATNLFSSSIIPTTSSTSNSNPYVPVSSCPLTSTMRTEIISTGVTGLLSTPVAPSSSSILTQGSPMGLESVSNPSLPASPKIGRSLRSRIGAAITNRGSSKSQDQTNGSATGNAANGDDEPDLVTNSYIPGDALNIPTLSPPPYKAPGSSSDSTSSILTGVSTNGGANGGSHAHSTATLSRIRRDRDENGDAKKNGRDRDASLSSSLRKYAQSQQQSSSSYGKNGPKTSDSSNSITNSSMAGGKTSIEAVRDGSNNNNTKRSSVVFEEPGGGTGGKLSSRVTSKTVNGILRKGSGPGDDLVSNLDPPRSSSKSRKKDHHRSKSGSKNRGSKSMDSNENGEKDDEKTGNSSVRSSRSRSNSTKSGTRNSGNSGHEKDKDKAENGRDKSSSNDPKKAQKDLALTRDLPWCGCWGNGCL